MLYTELTGVIWIRKIPHIIGVGLLVRDEALDVVISISLLVSVFSLPYIAHVTSC